MAKKKKKKDPRKPRSASVANPWPEKLKALREKLGRITQAEAAQRADVTTRTWISWENDQRMPSKAMQVLLLQIFPDLA